MPHNIFCIMILEGSRSGRARVFGKHVTARFQGSNPCLSANSDRAGLNRSALFVCNSRICGRIFLVIFYGAGSSGEGGRDEA